MNRRIACIVPLSLLVALRTSSGQDAFPRVELGAPVGRGTASPPRPVTGFDVVADAYIDSSGRTFVLDSRRNSLSVYTASGQPIATSTTAPRAEDRLAVPRAVAVDAAGTLLVLDVARERIVRYRLHDHRLDVVRADSLGLAGSDICVLDGRIFVAGRNDSTLVHAYSGSGRQLHSFGALPGQEFGALVTGSLASNSRLACEPNAKVIVVAAALLPTLRGFSPEGRLLWTTDLSGFSTVQITATARRATFSAPADGNDIIESMFAVAPGVIAVQTTRQSPGPRTGVPSTPLTRFISLVDGRELGAQSTLPLILATSRRYALELRTVPTPEVVLHSYHYQAH